MKYTCSAICDIGKVRKNNEDNCYVNGNYRSDVDSVHFEYSSDFTDQEMLAAVFDGMGGEADGELASLEAAKRLGKYQNSSFADIAEGFVMEANSAICDMMDVMGKGRMGSTLAIVQIDKESFSLCNIGDSPVYLFHDGELEQLSMDHNEAQNLYEMGIISKDEVKTDKHKNYLTQHLGIYEDEMVIEPYVLTDQKLKDEDVILICSDGLTDMVSERDIARIIGQDKDVDTLAHELISAALDGGGRDNVTVVIIRVQK